MLRQVMAFFWLLSSAAAQMNQQLPVPGAVAGVATTTRNAAGKWGGSTPEETGAPTTQSATEYSLGVAEIADLTTLLDSGSASLKPSPLMMNIIAVREGIGTTGATAGALLPSVALPNAMLIAPRVPPPEVRSHQFFDKKNVIGFAVHGAIRIADTAQTCALLNKTGRREAWLPFKSCSGVAVYSMSMLPAQIGNSYLLHRLGHYKLERISPYVWAAPSAAGIAFSIKAW